MIRIQKGSSMDLDTEDWDDSESEDDPVIYSNRNSITMYKFLPPPNLTLTGRSTTLNPVDRTNRFDRVSRGTVFPLSRPKPSPDKESEWEVRTYRFKLSELSNGQKNSDCESGRRYRAKTTSGSPRLSRYKTSLDYSGFSKHGIPLSASVSGVKCTSASGERSGRLPPLDPDCTVSPAMLKDILESEGVSKSTITQVVKDQTEKRSAAFRAEDHLRRNQNPSVQVTQLKTPNAAIKTELQDCNTLTLPQLLSPILPTMQQLTPPLSSRGRSKSFDDGSDRDSEGTCDHQDLDTWRNHRECRLRPWVLDSTSPQQSPMGSRSDLVQAGLEYGERTRGEIDTYSSEIEKTKWLSEIQLERTFYSKGLTLPRVILVSSKVRKAKQLEKVIKQENHLLYVPYDFDLFTFDEILSKVKNALQAYRRGCRAKSILIICQGGAGHLYLLRRKVVTPQKLVNPAHRDIVDFWKGLGDCLTKLDPGGASIHILGCCIVGNKQGEELLGDLQKLFSSSNIVVEAPLEISAKGHRVIETYFDSRRYKTWKMCQYSSVDSIKFASTEDSACMDNERKAKTDKDVVNN